MCTNKNCTKIPSSWSGSIRATILTQLFVGLMLVLGSQFAVHGQQPFCQGDPIPFDPAFPNDDTKTQQNLRIEPFITDLGFTDGACPANDIRICSARIELDDPCNTCEPGTTVTGNLIITVDHNTQSADRHLGVFGDLIETDPDGNTSSCSVARCSGPLLKDQEEFLSADCDGDGTQESVQELDYGPVTFTCGNSLVLDDILLAWTAANGECPINNGNNPNGKYCWDNPTIIIEPPMNAVIEAQCGVGNTANYDLTVTGGSGNFTYLWSNGATTEDLVNVPLGTYSVVITDVDSDDGTGNPCTIEVEETFNGPCCEFFATCNPLPDTDVEGCDISDLPPASTDPNDVFSNITTIPCGTLVFISQDVPSGALCPPEGEPDLIVIRTYTLFDDLNDNQVLDPGEEFVSCDQTFTIQDTTDPDPPEPPADVTVQCADDIPPPVDLTAEDICDGTITVSPTPQIFPGSCPNDFVMVRTWTFVDSCGNETSVMQTITVNDTTDPTASNPAPINVECSEDVPAPDIDVVTDEADNCVGDLVVTHVGDVSDGNTCPEVITRTYRVTDACGNFTDVTQTITIDDETDPTASNPAPINVECSEDVPAPDIDVVTDEADNCVGDLVVTHVGDVSDGNTCPEVITRTYRVTDACGNFTDVTQTITIDDETDPTASNPAPINVECSEDVPAPDIDVVTDEADNCVGDLVVTHVGDVSDGNTCPEVITRTYRVTDACGNFTDVTQTITIDDETDPTASNPAPINVECSEDVPAPDIDVVTDEADNCVGDLVVTHVGDVSDGNTCPEVITRTYRVTDACGNFTDVTQTITIDDETDPTASNPAPINVECSEDVPAPDIDVVTDEADNCVGDLVVTHVGDVSDGNTCPEVITRTYRVTDACGNFTDVTQTITIDDETDPTASNPAPINVECSEDVPAPDIDVVTDEADNCVGDLVVTHVGDVSDGNTCPEVITRTYRVTDACGNFTDVTQTITIDDETDPTASNPAPINVECSEDVPAPDIDVVTDEADNCVGDLVVTHVGDVSDGNTCPEVITRTYRVTDACGNFTDVTQTITIDDETDPTASNPAPINVECSEDVPAPDIDVVTDEADNCVGDLVVTHVGDVSDGNTCPEVITRTYRVTDACGNFTDVTQTITIDDETDPTASNPAPINVECSEDVPAPDIDVVTDEADNCVGDLVVTHVGDVSDGNTCPEVITRTYRVTDACGNFTDVTQTITIDDETDPTASNPAPINVECSEDVPAPDIDVVTDEADNCVGDLVVTHVGDVSDGNTCPEVITRTYRVTDACGNFTDVTQTITIDDETDPTASNPAPINVECSEDVPAPDIDVVTDEADNCVGDLVVTHVGDVSDGNTCPEVITRTYRVTDACGNFTDVTQTITIDDETDPTASNPAPINVECSEDVPAPDIDVVTDEADNCVGDLVVTHVGDVSDGNTCPEVITRTYRVTDACGNFTDVTQTITIDDETDPTASNPAPINVECSEDVPAPDIDVVTDEADNCVGDLVVTHVGDVSDGNTCPEVITRTYRVTDACGNFTDVMQTITVDDETDPVISGCPEGDDLNIVLTGCGGDCEIPDPPVVTAMDNCDGDLGEIDPVIVDTGEESCPRVITRTWTATDECGNTVSCSQTIVCEPPIAITPTGTECTSDPNNPDHGDFGFDQGNGNFIPLEELTYQTQTKQGVTTVKNANPGAMILFRKVVSTEETITITIDQSNTLGWDPIEYPQNLAGSIRLYDEGCIQLNAALVSVDVDGNGDLTAVFNVDNPDGDPICYTFYAKSLPSSLKGNEVDPLGETGEYCFNVEVDSDATTTEEICIDVVQE